jgi:hypothetical protein
MAEKLTAQDAIASGDISVDDILYLVDLTGGIGGIPKSKKSRVDTFMESAAVREILLDYLGDTVWQDGGGVTATHSDAGNTITLGVTGVLEDLNTLGTAAADGEFIVATGAGAFAYESGATARASLGVDAAGTAAAAVTTHESTYNHTNYDTAYGWGDHASGGYLTSETSHADVVQDGDFASNGILKRTSAGVYGIVTDASANWNTAYGWGDHASGGYGAASAVSLNTTHRTSDGSDHAFIDQSVISGASPAFVGTNISGVPAASILAGSFGSGAFVFDNRVTAGRSFTVDNGGFDATSSGQGTLYSDSVNGVQIHGTGSVNDFRLLNSAGTQVMRNPTGTANAVFAGTVSGITTLTATSLAGTLTTAAQGNVTSTGNLTVPNTLKFSTLAATTFLIGSETATGTGNLFIQQGAGAGGYGGGIRLYAHAHATKPGDVAVGVSAASGGAFRVNASGNDSGTDWLKSNATGLVVLSDLTLASGSITSASGAISFGNENVSTTGNIQQLSDSGGIFVGAGNDGYLRHDGTDTYLQNLTGRLFIWNTAASSVQIATSGVERYAISAAGAHDFKAGNITTTGTLSAGATTVTGDLTVTGGELYITDGGAGSPLLSIRTDDANPWAAIISNDNYWDSSANGLKIQQTNTGNIALQVNTNAEYKDLQFQFKDNSTTVTHTMDETGLSMASGSSITTTGTISAGAGSGFGIAPTDGTLHVATDSAGSVSANGSADDLVVEGLVDPGISLLSPDNVSSSFYFGSPSDNRGAKIAYNHDAAVFNIGPDLVGASMNLYSDDGVTNITLSGASGSELATFAGTIRASRGAAATPGYAFGDDTDTGIRGGGSDTLQLITGATVGYTLDASQNSTFAGDLTVTAGNVKSSSNNDPWVLHGLASTNDYTGIRFGYNATTYQKGGVFFERLGGGAIGSLHLCTTSDTSSGNVGVSDAALTIDSSKNTTLAGDLTVSAGTITSSGTNTASQFLATSFNSGSSANALTIGQGATNSLVFAATTGNATFAGDLTISGDVVMMAALPTSDPSNAGQLWNNSGVVTVSA